MSDICRRCHRALRNKTSVQHGFGPVCWRKLQNTAYEERPTSLRITIIDQAMAQESLERIREMMKHAEKKECCKCGKPLNPANLEYYDHEGGYDLPGFGKPQWLYHQCKCGYGYSLWKLRIPELLLASCTVVNVDISCDKIRTKHEQVTTNGNC